MIMDPVCGMKIDAERAPASSAYEGHRYYFCCEECRLTFDSNPMLYLEDAKIMNPEVYGRPELLRRR